MNNLIDNLFLCVYNLTILVGTAYLVQVHNWSGWWFLLAVCCLASSSSKKTKCECKYEPPKKEEKKIIHGRHLL